MTLKFNRVLDIVEMRVRVKFHQAECSGSWVIVVTEKKKLGRTQYSPSLCYRADCNVYLWCKIKSHQK